MRVLKAVPDIESKIEDGSLPISTLSQAQVFFRQEAILEPDRKIEILNALEGKSTREVEKFLVQKSSAPEKLIPESIRTISAGLYHLSLSVDESLARHRMKEPKEIPKRVAVAVTPARGKNSDFEKSTRYISSETKKRVWMRDKGCCSYKNPKTGRACASRHFLEFDHILPFVFGRSQHRRKSASFVSNTYSVASRTIV